MTDKDLGNAVGNQGNALLGQKIAGGVPFDKPFGGFISGVTPCICDTLGFIIDIAGPFGGSFVYSFTDKPKIHFGSFLSVAGPVLGAAKGSVSCGTDIDHGSCRGRRSGDLLKIIGGVL